MMDTVWIRLTTTTKDKLNPVPVIEEEEYFMFGPTGVVRFKRFEDQTFLYNSAKTTVAVVLEEPEHIMKILRTIRGTNGKTNESERKKVKSKSSTSHK